MLLFVLFEERQLCARFLTLSELDLSRIKVWITSIYSHLFKVNIVF